jgi:lysophospholipase L1-like esterase
MEGMMKRELSGEIASYVAIGDSFTEGLHDPGPDGGYLGWADRVAGALAQHEPGFRYANLAIRGKLLGQVIAEQLPRAVEMAPDLVSLAAGGNDILSGADVDLLAAHFEPAVAKLQAAGCRVLIFTGFDPRKFPVIRLLRGRIAAYNMHLRGIADDYGCDLVDLWSMRALKDPRAWSPDRLHLTTEGHRRVALRACEVLGVPVAEDWRRPLSPPLLTPTLRASGPANRVQGRARRQAAWLAARRDDARWAREYAAPWVRRRFGGTSSGDGVRPKRPDLLPV